MIMTVTVRIFFKQDEQSQAAKRAASEAVASGSVAVSFRGEFLPVKHVPAAEQQPVATEQAEAVAQHSGGGGGAAPEHRRVAVAADDAGEAKTAHAFFYPHPSARCDVTTRVDLLPVPAASPCVPELSTAQHLAAPKAAGHVVVASSPQRPQDPGPVNKLAFDGLPRRSRPSLDGQPCRLASLAATLSVNLCHSRAFRDQILETLKMVLATEGGSQRIEIQDGLAFFYPRPSAGYDVTARVNLLSVVPTALPFVPELSTAQRLALGFGRKRSPGLTDKISFDVNRSSVGVQAKPDQASLEKHAHELSHLDAKIKESLHVAAAKNEARRAELLQFLENQKDVLLKEQQQTSVSVAEGLEQEEPEQGDSEPDEDFLQLLERGVAQEIAIISRAEARERRDPNLVEFRGIFMDEEQLANHRGESSWAEAKKTGRAEWGIEHAPIKENACGMDELPFPLRRFVVPGLDDEDQKSGEGHDPALSADFTEAEETADPSTFRPSQNAPEGDLLSFEVPTRCTDVILEGTTSMEQADTTQLRRRALCNFKAVWPGATFEDGVAWAVVGAHTPLTEEEAEFAETGYLNSMRPDASGLEDLDFSMPAEQPAAWAVVVPDGVWDIIDRDEATEAQLAVHAARAARTAADLAVATANRRAQLTERFKSAPPSAEFLAERLAPSEADMSAIIEAHTKQRQAERERETQKERELIELAAAGTNIDPHKMAAFFARKGTPPRPFLESNWPVDEAVFARAHALKRSYREVKAAMDAGEDLGEQNQLET